MRKITTQLVMNHMKMRTLKKTMNYTISVDRVCIKMFVAKKKFPIQSIMTNFINVFIMGCRQFHKPLMYCPGVNDIQLMSISF